jgi:hypothetical protein
MTLRLSEDQTDALRALAAQQRRSMQDIAVTAVDEYVRAHAKRALLDDVLDFELARYADALERLGK